MVFQVVLVRHGESIWNKENLFTGWTDVGLTETGREEAHLAGLLLKDKGFQFDICYTSVLKRAIHSLDIILEETDQAFLPVVKAWELNERMYGALQGLNKQETAEKYGEDQVKIWRRSYDIPPPALEKDDERHPSKHRVFGSVPENQIPLTESLKSTLERFLPFWKSNIAQTIKSGKRVLMVAHGNSIRALIKHLDDVSDETITELNIPTGVPLVYELDDDLNPIKHYYLGDEKEIAAKQAAVAAQAASKKSEVNGKPSSTDTKDESKDAKTKTKEATTSEEEDESGVAANPVELAKLFAHVLQEVEQQEKNLPLLKVGNGVEVIVVDVDDDPPHRAEDHHLLQVDEDEDGNLPVVSTLAALPSHHIQEHHQGEEQQQLHHQELHRQLEHEMYQHQQHHQQHHQQQQQQQSASYRHYQQHQQQHQHQQHPYQQQQHYHYPQQQKAHLQQHLPHTVSHPPQRYHQQQQQQVPRYSSHQHYPHIPSSAFASSPFYPSSHLPYDTNSSLSGGGGVRWGSVAPENVYSGHSSRSSSTSRPTNRFPGGGYPQDTVREPSPYGLWPSSGIQQVAAQQAPAATTAWPAFPTQSSAATSFGLAAYSNPYLSTFNQALPSLQTTSPYFGLGGTWSGGYPSTTPFTEFSGYF